MSDQILESTQGNIYQISLISSTGKRVDIKAMAQDFIIFEDIYQPSIHGEIHIKDSQNLPVALDLHGNEYIFVSFGIPTLKPIEKYFRLYSITDIKPTNPTTLTYIMHFCSEEAVLNQQILMTPLLSHLI